MVDTKTEAEIRRKAETMICWFKGCNKPGKTRIQQAFATTEPGTSRPIQARINAWACEDPLHRGGR